MSTNQATASFKTKERNLFNQMLVTLTTNEHIIDELRQQVI